MLRQLQGELSRAEERADAIAFEILALKRALAADASGRLAQIAGFSTALARNARRRDPREAALREAAAEGVGRVEFRWLAGGEAMVRVDEGKWFNLPQNPASLLWILAHAKPGDDGFPAWLTHDDVADRLAQKSGRRLSRHALTQLVYRLRRLMSGARANAYLLQVRGSRGLRFLVRTS